MIFHNHFKLKISKVPSATGIILAFMRLDEQSAQAILDTRALYPDCSLADLYDEVTMPPELRKAHQQNDKAVMQSYGFWCKLNTETECVAELIRMYLKLTK